MSDQLGFDFDGAPGAVSGLHLWRVQHRAQIEILATRSGLPIGHAVRLWLTSGIFLEGKLTLVSDDLLVDQRRTPELRLQIGRADFRAAEVESCVRID